MASVPQRSRMMNDRPAMIQDGRGALLHYQNTQKPARGTIAVDARLLLACASTSAVIECLCSAKNWLLIRFIPPGLQPPEEAQTTSRSPPPKKTETRCRWCLPRPLLHPRPQLLFQVLPMSKPACGNAAVGLMWYPVSQIAVGGNCDAFSDLPLRTAPLHSTYMTRAL